MIDSIKEKMLKLLNEHVPEDIAMKGINAISPDIGSFLKRGVSQGLPLAQGLNFLRKKFSMSSNKLEQNPNQRPDERAAMRQREQSENEASTIKQAAGLGATALAGAGAGRALGAIGGALSNAMGAKPDNAPPEPQEETKQRSPEEDLSFNYPELFEFIQKEIQKGRTPSQAAALARLPGKFERRVKKFEKEKGVNLADYLESIFGQKKQQQKQQGQGNQALLSAIDKIMKM